MSELIRRDGYIYSPKTAEGFDRMQRQGIPRPLFSLERKLAKLMQKTFNKEIKKMLQRFKSKLKEKGLVPSELTQDGPDDLIEFLRLLRQQDEESRKRLEELDRKLKIQSVASELEAEWNEPYVTDPESMELSALEEQLAKILKTNQEGYLQRLEADASPLFEKVLTSFSIDKQKLFDDNMSEIRRLYINNSIQRIQGEEDLIKKTFLQRLTDYVEGRSDSLNIHDIVNILYQRSKSMSQFFARDQLARLNKATTLSTFSTAGVTKVKWVTTHDVRVRPSHKKLDGKIFDVNNLPPEVDDYNCRCGLVPVEYKQD